MLEHIFGSKTRAKLLYIFFKNPRRAFYIRQLAREAKTQLNSVRREVENLLRMHIIQQVDQGKEQIQSGRKEGLAADQLKKYFRVNEQFLLYPELRALILKAQLLVEKKYIQRIEEHSKLVLFILSGVFLGVENAPTDMLLVGVINRKRLQRIIQEFERDLNREIRYTIMTVSEYKYRRDITDKFLYTLLENKHIVIIDKFRAKISSYP